MKFPLQSTAVGKPIGLIGGGWPAHLTCGHTMLGRHQSGRQANNDRLCLRMTGGVSEWVPTGDTQRFRAKFGII